MILDISNAKIENLRRYETHYYNSQYKLEGESIKLCEIQTVLRRFLRAFPPQT